MDLTTSEGVVSLMKSSESEKEWNDNCDSVKAANKGYPDFWYSSIVLSGLMKEVSAKWGGDDQIRIYTFDVKGE